MGTLGKMPAQTGIKPEQILGSMYEEETSRGCTFFGGSIPPMFLANTLHCSKAARMSFHDGCWLVINPQDSCTAQERPPIDAWSVLEHLDCSHDDMKFFEYEDFWNIISAHMYIVPTIVILLSANSFVTVFFAHKHNCDIWWDMHLHYYPVIHQVEYHSTHCR